MQPQLEFDRLQERFRDPIQRRYEIIRPLVLWQDRTAIQRAEETRSHPETIGTLTRRFAQQGMLGKPRHNMFYASASLSRPGFSGGKNS